MTENDNKQTAIFAAGCFWGIQRTFSTLKGVLKTTVGYTGGHIKHPTYQQVCSGKTGHAEAIEIIFEHNIISYQQLLDIFWQSHNPTMLNQQGPDIGTQYRSAIFFMNVGQQQEAEKSKVTLQQSGHYQQSIVTEITPASEFYVAEDYHQHYLVRNN